jgi:hypothetical protein
MLPNTKENLLKNQEESNVTSSYKLFFKMKYILQ